MLFSGSYIASKACHSGGLELLKVKVMVKVEVKVRVMSLSRTLIVSASWLRPFFSVGLELLKGQVQGQAGNGPRLVPLQ
jgi:hypothetical protein